MRALRSIILVALTASPAAAHETAVPHQGDTLGWSWDPWLLVPLTAAALLYAVGCGRLLGRAHRGRPKQRWQAVGFWAGWSCLLLAAVSPLHALGERLFTAHMAEHEALTIVAAPLLVLSRPGAALAWALPAAMRRWFAAVSRATSLRRVWYAAAHPAGATILHGLALWAWHAPVLFGAALGSPGLHRLQHLSFFGTALLFWWSLLHHARDRRAIGLPIFCLFATSVHSGALGMLLTLSPRIWYPTQGFAAAAYGLSPLEDQQLAGVLMWVPGGVLYVVAAVALAGLWIGTSSRQRGAAVPSGGVRGRG